MNHIAAKIEALATTEESVWIPIGPDMVPVEFLKVGDREWIAPCSKCNFGVILTDSPEFAAAICDACEDALDLEAVQTPRAPGVLAMVPAPRPPSSLVSVAPKLEIVVPSAAPAKQQWPSCNSCGKNLAPDNSSGHFGKKCSDCQEAKAPKVRPGCRECGCSLNGLHSSREYCSDCARGRLLSGQRRQTATSRANKERAKAMPVVTTGGACTICGRPTGKHQQGKYCPEHALEMQNKHRRENMAKKRAREKQLTTNQGEAA